MFPWELPTFGSTMAGGSSQGSTFGLHGRAAVSNRKAGWKEIS